MRTCKFCGCYLPDNFNICIACGHDQADQDFGSLYSDPDTIETTTLENNTLTFTVNRNNCTYYSGRCGKCIFCEVMITHSNGKNLPLYFCHELTKCHKRFEKEQYNCSRFRPIS